MIVCICNNVSDKTIKTLVEHQGVGTIRELKQHLSIANQCGTCIKLTQELIDTTIVDESLFKNVG